MMCLCITARARRRSMRAVQDSTEGGWGPGHSHEQLWPHPLSQRYALMPSFCRTPTAAEKGEKNTAPHPCMQIMWSQWVEESEKFEA
jgi:hypothetical protein